ncbi:MAG TPA: sigma-54 dependent transcriptional regulator [Vicinamibacteria bacterium]
MRRTRILVMDDEAGIRLGLRRFLEAQGFDVEEAQSCREAEEAFRAMPPDAAILDHRVPDGSGVELVPRLKELSPSAPLIVLTGHGSIELAVRAIKDGADQFLTKPVELPALQMILERVLENQRNRQKQLAGRSRQAREAADPFLGGSPALRRLADEARKVVASESPILIEGETGTGKGVLARWLHLNGPRRQEPFVDLNCAGLSRELLETELFGHEKGAFTGATATKIGLVEVAHRGTVFLDEIGDLDPPVQPKLLTVLEERRFRRLGDVRDRHVDIRLVAATHHDLARLVEESRFRRDLFFRISTLPLRVPPLRERLEDIPLLARHFLDRFGLELGRRGATLSAEALAALQQYQWPGNVRELRNVLERALLVAEGETVRAQDLRFASVPPAAIPDGVLSLDELERCGIARALDAERGHVGRAAVRLGVPRSSLYKKIKRYGLVAGQR